MSKDSINYTFKQKISNKYNFGFYLLDLYKKVYKNQDYKYICSFKLLNIKESKPVSSKIEEFLKCNTIDFLTADRYNTWIAIKTKEDLKIVRQLIKIYIPYIDINKVLKVSSLNHFRLKCIKYQNNLTRRYNNYKSLKNDKFLNELVSEYQTYKRKR